MKNKTLSAIALCGSSLGNEGAHSGFSVVIISLCPYMMISLFVYSCVPVIEELSSY